MKKQRRIKAEINPVPYIDVMMVLLVIFMVTSPTISPNLGVDVDLPQAEAQPYEIDAENLPIVVSIDAAGLLYLNTNNVPDEPLEVNDLLTRVTAMLRLNPKQEVQIQGDQNIDYGRVTAVLALLQQAGAGNVGLMLNPTDSNN